MVKEKRITKRQLKEPDEFISLTERALHFLETHAKKMALGGGVILVVILAVVFYQMWERGKEEEAGRAYGVASEMYERRIVQTGDAAPQDYAEILAKFDEMVTKFPRTSFGRYALIYAGNIRLRQGEYDEAIKKYGEFLGRSGRHELFTYFALDGMGHAYEGKKDYVKAIETYQKILDGGQGFQIDEARISIGLCYEKIGKPREGLDHLKAFLKDSPKSLLSNVVSWKVSLLEKM